MTDAAPPNPWRRSFGRVGVVGLFVVAGAAAVGGAPRQSSGVTGSRRAAPSPAAAVTPIRHVVVIFQENHSFDNVLGGLCVSDRLDCDRVTTGLLHNGVRVPLAIAPDIVSQVDHKVPSQAVAINHGRMNGFDLIRDCGLDTHYVCYSQYQADEIPNLRVLAENYVISDRTFSEDPVPSWGGHLDLIAGQLDGFEGVGPRARTRHSRTGMGM